jgi:hypothetical protein
MNMQYNWVNTALDDAPWPYPMEQKEMKRPAPEPEDLIGKAKDLVITTMAPPMPKEKAVAAEPKSAPGINASALGAKIKEAIQTDYDPEESLAAIRAILVGPTRRLHDARIEEIVSILEESDRANQTAFERLENRCEDLSAKLDAEVKKAIDLQLRYLAEFSFAVDKKFELSQSELNGKLAEAVGQSQAAITQISHQFTVQLKDHDRKIAGTFESLTAKFEQRFLKLDEHADQLQQRSAEVFVEGLNDIAKRITALKRTAA